MALISCRYVRADVMIDLVDNANVIKFALTRVVRRHNATSHSATAINRLLANVYCLCGSYLHSSLQKREDWRQKKLKY